MRAVCFLRVILVLFAGSLLPAQSPASTQMSPALPSPNSEQQLFASINQERERAGLPKLQWNEQLAQAARAHAKLLATNNALSHQFSGEPELAERLGGYGARFTFSAENIARADSAEEAHMGLMTSPGHRANILSSRYNAVGIAAVESQGHLFVTEDFAVLLPKFSEAQFTAELIQTINRARAAKHLFRLDIQDDIRLRSAACAARGNVRSMADAASPGSEMVLFTISDPQALPARLLQFVQEQRWRKLVLGACFQPGAQHGYANFWVAAAFGN
ncbi:MAG TPA: CAP domain-containing protein [Terriglobales bacterium]|nr:CAP domain-containing protein [Terriglobales bacterium]